MSAPIARGTIVENPLKPEWGPGKVVRAGGPTVEVFFRDLPGDRARKFKTDSLRVAAVQDDPFLDNLPPFREHNGELVLPSLRTTLAQARDRFLRHYPGGFSDPGYLGTENSGERNYKLAAHDRFVQAFGGSRGRELLEAAGPGELGSRLGRILGTAANLLAKTEYIAFREGLASEAPATRYFATLFDLIESGPEEERFMAHADAAASLPAQGQTHTDKWTIVTILPYLARPDVFMFVKPTNIQAAASVLGFDIRYDPRPNWRTYHAVLRMTRLYNEALSDLRPRDFIDIQSFFWVTGDSFEKTLARHRSR
jgi:hypothetical protein